jgi:diadenosine tetraphosphate (Ap4A) HIT family hydrolase
MQEDKCHDCQMFETGSVPNVIMENAHSCAVASDSWREGHCIVYLKRHVVSVSGIKPEEYADMMDLVVKVSKALEQKYGTRKTYIVSVGDSNKWQHFHIHLLPKHRSLPSYGVYAVQKLAEAEPPRKPTVEERISLAKELRSLIDQARV